MSTWRFFQVKDFVPFHVPNHVPIFFSLFPLVLKYSLIYPIFLSHVPYVVPIIPMWLLNLSHVLCQMFLTLFTWFPCPWFYPMFFAQSPPITYSIGGSNGKHTLALCWTCLTFEACFFCDGPIIEASHYKKWFEFLMIHNINTNCNILFTSRWVATKRLRGILIG